MAMGPLGSDLGSGTSLGGRRHSSRGWDKSSGHRRGEREFREVLGHTKPEVLVGGVVGVGVGTLIGLLLPTS